MISKTFRQAVREERERRDWSQAELSKRVTDLGHDLDQSAVSRIESGPRKVTLDDAVAIAAALDVPLLRLLLSDEDVALTPELTLRPLLAEAWMVGVLPLRSEDADTYGETAKSLPAPFPWPALFYTGRELGRPLSKDEQEALRAQVVLLRRELEASEILARLNPDLAESIERGDARRTQTIEVIEALLPKERKR